MSFDKNSALAKTMENSPLVKEKHYFDQELLNLDLERIRIFISILEEHEANCEKDERFPEAAITRDKIKVLRDVEEIKILSDLNKFQSDQVSALILNY